MEKINTFPLNFFSKWCGTAAFNFPETCFQKQCSKKFLNLNMCNNRDHQPPKKLLVNDSLCDF